MSSEGEDKTLLALAVQIVSAYVRRDGTPVAALPALLRDVLAVLREAGPAPLSAAAMPPQRDPAVPIDRSITPEYLVCLEDGRRLKTLKRHLRAAYGLTPEAYRARWGLPPDYPMVAPGYARTRSSLAKAQGLGRPPRGE